MEVLKKVLLLFLLVWSSASYSKQSFKIDDVKVNCSNEEVCEDLREMTKSLVHKDVSTNNIKNKINFILNDSRISKLIYRIVSIKKKLVLVFDVATKLKISRIEHKSNLKIPFDKILSFLSIKEGEYLNDEDLEISSTIINKQLKDKGYGDIKISFKLDKRKQSVEIMALIHINKIIKLKKVIIKSIKGESLDKAYRLKFSHFINDSWDVVRFKVAVDEISQELLKEGYFFSNITLKSVINDHDEVTSNIIIHRGPRVNFSFSGQHILERKELLDPVISKMKGSIDFISNNDIKVIIDNIYKKRGFYGTKITIRVQNGHLRNNVNYKNYFIELVEGEKVHVGEIIYKGNIHKKISQLRDFYYSKASTLALRDYLDESYINEFPKLLKQFYVEGGFVSAEIFEPTIQINNKLNTARVIFKIIERQQVLVEKIDIQGVTPAVEMLIKKKMTSKEGSTLNIVSLGKELEAMLNLVRNQGYFYAQLININKSSLVEYNGSRNRATLKLIFNLNKKTIFDDVLITGNIKTKNEVIRREVLLKKNEIITPDKLENIKAKLSNLGLFSLIRISPYLLSSKLEGNDHRANILIQLREKEFGNGEFAPGYRTDLGAKISVSINYNNTLGLHHTNSLKIQTNQRLDSSTLDVTRQKLYEKEIEYFLKWNYNWPYFLKSNFDFDFTSTIQRRRYFGFDADILRVGPKFSRSFGEYVSASLKYQFETISQFNATAEKDSDYFRIGSISPSLNIDLRDNVVNTRNGAFFGLSMEIATPGLQSLRDEDLEVNYIKLISRNKFYYSFGNWTFALSVAAGLEKNNGNSLKFDSNGNQVFNADGSASTIGFIPSIKVFRMDGVDTVRGYSDSEINLIDNTEDIGEIIIQDKAYFMNLKFEPRYLVNDVFMWGAFFDAGRVFVDHFKPLDLRTSVGLTVKVLTPVGSLDFDYGVKLKRNIKPDLDRETFGRFHLSIGYF
jgi:outer membrane protein insertion porin family